MHKAIVLTGFLGTGKTTVLLAAALRLTERDQYVAIIENERGTIGIDGRYLTRQGLTVRELRAGCVCCDLSLPLQMTVHALKTTYDPDWLLVEASGVARATALRASLRTPGLSDLPWRFVTVLDAPRFQRMWADTSGIGGLLREQLAVADLIVLTKAEQLTTEQLAETAHAVRELRSGVPVIPFSADDELAARLLVRALEEI